MVMGGGLYARRVERFRRAADEVEMPLPDRPGSDSQWRGMATDVVAIRKSIRRQRRKTARRQ
jgi:hypothetical protein